ncbi:hypothetical protein ATCVCanal1_483L [Acanthocystis turfacea Chlorella virus Canal-1]|nr:hypothetical protein ATCVCanal1_483L [Acanthocystis turfacea Chlorella virus Canal-1]
MIPAKIQIVLFSILVFMIVSSPMTYKFTNAIASKVRFTTVHGDSPTRGGIFLHAVVFGLLMYGYLMTFQM